MNPMHPAPARSNRNEPGAAPLTDQLDLRSVSMRAGELAVAGEQWGLERFCES